MEGKAENSIGLLMYMVNKKSFLPPKQFLNCSKNASYLQRKLSARRVLSSSDIQVWEVKIFLIFSKKCPAVLSASGPDIRTCQIPRPTAPILILTKVFCQLEPHSLPRSLCRLYSKRSFSLLNKTVIPMQLLILHRRIKRSENEARRYDTISDQQTLFSGS